MKTLLLLAVSAAAFAQPPASSIQIGSTNVAGGTPGDCLIVNSARRLGQQVCGGGGGGVTSITAGTGISVNASTGAVTVTNTALGGSPAGPAGTCQFSNVATFEGDPAKCIYNLTAIVANPPTSVTPQGTPGSSTWSYAQVEVTPHGQYRPNIGLSAVSANTTTATGAATLDGTNFNRIVLGQCADNSDTLILFVTAVPGATDLGMIASGLTCPVTPGATVFDDQTGEGDFAQPSATDTSIGLYNAGYYEGSGPLRIDYDNADGDASAGAFYLTNNNKSNTGFLDIMHVVGQLTGNANSGEMEGVFSQVSMHDTSYTPSLVGADFNASNRSSNTVDAMTGANISIGGPSLDAVGLFISDVSEGTNSNKSIKSGLGGWENADYYLSDGVSFGNLPTPTAGMQIYCTDCQPTTIAGGIVTDPTCKASGTGANAVYLNGAWTCQQYH